VTSGRAPGKNDERLLEVLKITVLDEIHALVRVSWLSRYRRPDGSEMENPFDDVYMVRTVEGATKTFVFITADEQNVLMEKGIIVKS
jgi:hypothetical protein